MRESAYTVFIPAMASVQDLVAARQETIAQFLTSAGDCFKPAPFVRDAALLSHPLGSLTLAQESGSSAISLDSVIAQLLGKRLHVDELELSAPSSYSFRQNKFGPSCIEFDNQGALFAVGGSNGVVRVYDSDESNILMSRRYGASSFAAPKKF